VCLFYQDSSVCYVIYCLETDPGGDLGRILEKEMELEEMQVKVWAA